MPIIYAANGSREQSRNKVLDLLREKRRLNKNFTVVDIGASANSWANEVVDVCIDVVQGDGSKPTIIGDINKPEVWAELKRKYDKVDFILCTHTLEDIRDPVFVIERLQEVAKAGYISMPNKYSELSHVESHFFTGWSHHRWIFSLVQAHQDWVLHFIPKYASANYYGKWSQHPLVWLKRVLHLTNKDKAYPKRHLSQVNKNKNIANLKNELGFIWENSFRYEYKDYFPSTHAILNDLRQFIDQGI